MAICGAGLEHPSWGYETREACIWDRPRAQRAFHDIGQEDGKQRIDEAEAASLGLYAQQCTIQEVIESS